MCLLYVCIATSDNRFICAANLEKTKKNFKAKKKFPNSKVTKLQKYTKA